MLDPEELCISCPKRDLCSCLCPEAEYYVGQDEVGQRELPIGLPRTGKWPESQEKSIFTPLEIKVMHALAEGRSRNQVSQELGITRQTVRSVIRNIKRKRA